MNESSVHRPSRSGAWNGLASVGPETSSADSEFRRRKRLAIRGGQIGMMMMVVAAVAATIVSGYRKLPAWSVGSLVMTSLVYVAWSLHGTRQAIRGLLGEGGTEPQVPWSSQAIVRVVLYFTVQLGLAGWMCYLALPANAVGLMWLVLLPPVGHSVLLLPRPGIAVVSLLSTAIFTFYIVALHGWKPVPEGLTGFSFGVLFTLVYTQIAVSAEQARAEVEQLADKLSEANLKLREYAVQAEELAVTRERNRLAREIHDSVGHYLTVVNVQLEAARAMLDRDTARALDALHKAQALTQDGLQEIRRSVAALRASPLDHQPLAEALRRLTAESQAAGLAAEMDVLGEPRTLSLPAELTLYRAGQEGLTNSRKHAQARHARLVLDFRAPGRVQLNVSDDGAGASQTAVAPGAPAGFGLLGLRERAQLVGGEVRVQTAPGQGFTLEVEVPG